MDITLETIIACLNSREVDFTVHGENISVKRMEAIDSKINEAICYYAGNDREALAGIEHSIVFCKPEMEFALKKNNTYIITKNPQLCFYYVSTLFEEPTTIGIDSRSAVDNSAVIGEKLSIGPFCTIEECIIGNKVVIESGVKIYKGSIIGNNVHIQSNTVIGAAGIMWAWDSQGNKVRCIQTGNVIIEDDVFVGSNITIVRGAFINRPTVIGRNSVIAHGTMIGHGSVIGSSNHFANNVSIAGSVMTGKNCFFGSGAIVRPHVKLPDDTIVGAGAVVVNDFLDKNLTLIGNPARIMTKKKETSAGVPAQFSL